jgi:peptidase E
MAVRPTPRIVALGGGGFSMEPRDPRMDDAILELTGKRRPAVCFVPTASGDSPQYVRRFLAAFPSKRAQASHLSLFQRDGSRLREQVLAQDVVYVGGGNVANLLAVWRLHGLDRILREAWRKGIVLCGVSAGALCWFESGLTDSFGPQLEPFGGGLGLLRGSACPHYDGEALRRPRFTELIASGTLPAGTAIDDGAGAFYEGRRLVRCAATREGARVWRVTRAQGFSIEEALPTALLPRRSA